MPWFFSIIERNKERAQEDGAIDTVLDILSTHSDDESVASVAIKALKSFIRDVPPNEGYIRSLISGNRILEPFSSKIFKNNED